MGDTPSSGQTVKCPYTVLFYIAEDSATVVGLDFSKCTLQLLDEMQQRGRVGLQNTGALCSSTLQMELQSNCGLHLMSESPAGQLQRHLGTHTTEH